MKITRSPFFLKYLLPGIVFQSVVIAGGYSTGREIVEFFLNFGPGGGSSGLTITDPFSNTFWGGSGSCSRSATWP